MNHPKKRFHSVILFSLSVLTLLLMGCSDDDSTSNAEVLASFSTSATTIAENESIQFIDESTGNPTMWEWTFEGGSPSTSNQQNPEIIYDKAGFYTVTLTASNGRTTNTLEQTRFIHVTCTGIYCESNFSTYTTADAVYGVNAEEHKMILYVPDGDTRTDRPAVALMGGGGWEGTNLDFLNPLAVNLVKHGVVVALLKYRVLDTNDSQTELINGQQDCRTAVRYLKKEAQNLGINPDHIFIGGNGSGASGALFHAYIDEVDLSTSEIEIFNGLGGLEGIDQGNDGFSSEVIGVISLAGAMFARLDPITSDDVPIYAIHGTADSEVPFGTGNTVPITYGSQPITEKVASVGLKSRLFTIENGDHEAPRTRSDDYIQELMYFIRDLVN